MNLYESLVNYVKSDYYPFHMPGHKRREFLDLHSPYGYDITEIEGFDNLHEAEGILARSMEEAARIYHTRATYYLINGSTSGLLAAISAVTEPGDEILMARNCHKAVYNAVSLRGLIPNYLYPPMIGEYNIAGSIEVSDVEQVFLSKHKSKGKIAAVIITSPTYDGVVSNIKEIAEVVHAHDSILIVDEAHGAHFPFSSQFPISAIECGADIVIQSIHKTLPALTQTALLHQNSLRVDAKRLKKYLSIYQSSSPSYILMSSIERCLMFVSSSKESFDQYLTLLNDFYDSTNDLNILKVWRPIKGINIYDKDNSKLIIGANNSEVSGIWIYEQLLNTYHIQAEMVMKDYVVCLSSVCDTKEGFQRLVHALHQMDQQISSLKIHDMTESEDCNRLQNAKMPSSEIVILPSKVDEYEHETKPLFDCEGEIAAEYIYLYPPGIPIVVPGERLSKSFLQQLRNYKLAGLSLRGMADHTGAYLDVLRKRKRD